MNQLYEFGDFRVYPAEQLLLYQGQPVALTPKVFETLVILLESDGRLIDKNDFIDKLWPGVFVEDVALAQNISHLRKALGDGANGTAVIQTVPKRGYRFVVPVRRVADQPTEPPRARSLRLPVPPGSADPIEDTEDAPALALTAPHWRRALPSALLGMTALAVAVAVLALLHFREKPPTQADQVRFQFALPETSIFLGELNVSPDGRHLAFTTLERDGSMQLWVRDLDSLVPRRLPTLGDIVWSPFWSPDSRAVAFQSAGKLVRVDISGGTPQVICSLSFLNNVGPLLGGAWNPDGAILFGSYKGLMKVSATGGEPSILIKAGRGQSWFGYPSFLPDGRHFLYNGQEDPYIHAYLGSLDAGDNQQSSKPLTSNAGVVYAPSSVDETGSVLLQKRDHSLAVQAFDASSMELKGDPRPVAEGVRHFNVSTNGVLAYSGGNQSPMQLTWFDRHGKVLGTVGEPGIDSWPAISPDGKTVAVSVEDGSTGRTDIWLYDLQSNRRTRFTLDGTANLFPVWSPDGSRIAFASNRHGTAVIYQKPVNGVGQEETFEKTPPYPARPLDWSLDGRYLIEKLGGDNPSIWVLPLSTGQTGGERKSVLWLNEGVDQVRLSPDGKWMAYRSVEAGRGEIFVRTFPNAGLKRQISTNGASSPLWSRDGKELFYIALDGNLMAVNFKSRPDGGFDAGAAKALFKPHNGPIPTGRIEVTKDGHFLIPALTQQPAAPITVIVNWRPALK